MHEFYLSNKIDASSFSSVYEQMGEEDPFFFWGRQSGMYPHEIRKILKLPNNADKGLPCDAGVLEGFCVEIGVHPADMFRPSDTPLPTVVVEAILSVAQDKEYSKADRKKAFDTLFVEREKFINWCNSEPNESPIHVINSATHDDLVTVAESIVPIIEGDTMYLSTVHALVADKKFDDFEEMLNDDVTTFRQQVEETKKQKERFKHLRVDTGRAIYREDYEQVRDEASKMLTTLVKQHGDKAYELLAKEILEPDGDFYPRGIAFMRTRSVRDRETGETIGWPRLAQVFAYSCMKFKALSQQLKELQAAYDNSSKRLFEYQDWHAACVHDGRVTSFANYVVSGLLSLDHLRDDEAADNKPESGMS